MTTTATLKFADPDQLVGFLVPHPVERGYGFHCCQCGPDPDRRTPVYGVNVNPYMVKCCGCGLVVVTGSGVELFDGK